MGIAFIAEIALATFARGDTADNFNPYPGAETNAEAIGQVMYTDYLLLFQLSGLILLVAMIGAIVLTLRHRPHVKRQNIAKQTARRRKDATRQLDVKSGEGL
jgi:NADH-quinone oxidoreductase subunit J